MTKQPDLTRRLIEAASAAVFTIAAWHCIARLAGGQLSLTGDLLAFGVAVAGDAIWQMRRHRRVSLE